MSRGYYHEFYVTWRKRLSVSDHSYTCECKLCRKAAGIAELLVLTTEPQETRAAFTDHHGSFDHDDY
ncbi:MAG: hypothetical protein P1P90_04590 [Patescibacteria group bacterium]|nr:hypothetical protein [Patescibacteria group bacterium]